mmetsp:Transcript_53202/g.133935  ORF Transcript_53202/g.133935 Transcript_53202/m.133935 type:complete len:206 (-) Transcript_53202:95-712(-)
MAGQLGSTGRHVAQHRRHRVRRVAAHTNRRTRLGHNELQELQEFGVDSGLVSLEVGELHEALQPEWRAHDDGLAQQVLQALGPCIGNVNAGLNRTGQEAVQVPSERELIKQRLCAFVGDEPPEGGQGTCRRGDEVAREGGHIAHRARRIEERGAFQRRVALGQRGHGNQATDGKEERGWLHFRDWGDAMDGGPRRDGKRNDSKGG